MNCAPKNFLQATRVLSEAIRQLIQDIIVVCVTCKNEEEPIYEGARVFTTLYINFSDAQMQITLESMVLSGRNLNSLNISCMSLLPTRMKMIQ